MRFRQIMYLPVWFIRNVILRKHGPLQTVLFITDYCNLDCRHCFKPGHACKMHKTYQQIEKELKDCWKAGSRFVDFEGGEPSLWRQKAGAGTPEAGVDGWRDTAGNPVLNINDLILLARKIGFFSCTVTTNAQEDFSWIKADLIWVSLDGFEKFHDAVRGEGAFAKLVKNTALFAKEQKKRKAASGQTCILGANMAVNKLNLPSVKDTVDFVRDSASIESIAINFHTPYPGTEDLMPGEEERCKVIDLLISLKKEKYPIQNSTSGLKIMKKKGFKKYCWISNFITADGTRYPTCPGRDLELCDDCGFCMAGEMYCVMHLKPDTLLAGINLRL